MGIRLSPDDLARSGTEFAEQSALICWVRHQQTGEPLLRLLFAIPNGGQRGMASASKAKAEGVKKGVSDLMLPVARHGYHGLWLEMKRADGGKESAEQKQWGVDMRAQGYAYCCCHGWLEAAEALRAWLGLRELPWPDSGKLWLSQG